MAVIEAYDLTRRFGTLTAVENLSLKIDAGEVLRFLGPNGAGKTTTIRMLAGVIAPTSGRAVVAGISTDSPVEQLHEVIGLLTETPGFYNRLSAYRNLEYFAGFYQGIDVKARVEKYLRIMGLWERRNDPVGAYSKGMKQRLALARALLHEPAALFLDEPTSGLDPEAADEVRSLIKQLSQEGKAVFLSTHNLAEAEHLCHRIATFRTRLAALDTPENLRRQLFRRRVSIRLENPTEELVKSIPSLDSVVSMSLENNLLKLELTNTQQDIPELVKSIVQAGGKIQGVTEEQHSLEEVYLNLVKEARE